MDRGIDVIAHHFFIYKNSVLVVITLPSHKSYESVFTERYFAVARCRTIRNDLTCFNFLANRNDWALVYAGSLV